MPLLFHSYDFYKTQCCETFVSEVVHVVAHVWVLTHTSVCSVAVVAAVAAVLAAVVGPVHAYRAAVAQVDSSKGASPADTLRLNAQGYAALMHEAKSGGADIVVFPEFGLNGGGFTSHCTSTSTPSPYCEPLPVNMTGMNPCTDTSAAFASAPTVAALSWCVDSARGSGKVCTRVSLHVGVLFAVPPPTRRLSPV